MGGVSCEEGLSEDTLDDHVLCHFLQYTSIRDSSVIVSQLMLSSISQALLKSPRE